MGSTKYLGKNVALELDVSMTETPDWEVVVCMTNNGLDGSREQIDANSKCGSDQLGGDKTDTASFEGFFVTNPDAGIQVTMNTMRDIYDAGDVHHFRFISADDGATVYREFNGTITTYNETFNNGEAVGYNGTISISGDVISEAPTT